MWRHDGGMTPEDAATGASSRDAAMLALLRAVRDFGDAHDRMNGALKHGMDMNLTDLAALRLLIMREERRAAVTPADISRHLRISTASTTKLLDRLAAAGHVVRVPHPTDGRALVVELTDHARAEFFHLFGQRLSAMRDAFGPFSDDELQITARVLDATAEAIAPTARPTPG